MLHVDFDRFVKYGFVSSVPVERLANRYQVFEDILDNLHILLKEKRLRAAVDNEMMLDGSLQFTCDEEEEVGVLKRLYSVLCMISHGYLFEDECQPTALPACLSVPLYFAARKLELPCVLCYSSFQLFNYKIKNGNNNSFDSITIDDIDPISSFTCTETERWFNIIPTAIEIICGAKAISTAFKLSEAIDNNGCDDSSKILELMDLFGDVIIQAGNILNELTEERCVPEIFYNDLRPYLRGFSNVELKGVYEDDGSTRKISFEGGSAAQSPLIQFFDIVLNIKHEDERTKGFLLKMRDYMPGEHKKFLNECESSPNLFGNDKVRNYAMSQSHKLENVEVRKSYNKAVKALCHFRNIHKSIACKYVVKQVQRRNNSIANHTNDIGTGGTNIREFLTKVRDETHDKIIPN